MAMRTDRAAVDAFVPLVGECETPLCGIALQVSDHFGVGPDGVIWGRVADATRVRDLLAEALAHLSGGAR